MYHVMVMVMSSYIIIMCYVVQIQSELTSILVDKDREILSLEEQIRDLEFYITTQGKVARSGLAGEIAQGQLIVMGNNQSETQDTPMSTQDRLKAIRNKLHKRQQR